MGVKKDLFLDSDLLPGEPGIKDFYFPNDILFPAQSESRGTEPYLQHRVIAHKPIRNQHLGKQKNRQEQPKISLIVCKRGFYQAYF